MDVVNDVAVAIDSSTESSAKTFVSGAVKPDDGIDAAADQSLWRSRLLGWLYE